MSAATATANAVNTNMVYPETLTFKFIYICGFPPILTVAFFLFLAPAEQSLTLN